MLFPPFFPEALPKEIEEVVGGARAWTHLEGRRRRRLIAAWRRCGVQPRSGEQTRLFLRPIMWRTERAW